MNGKQYTIEDLCELTGFTRRTIRYYVQEGLLDPPAGRGRGGFYFDSHLTKLMEIKSFQDRGLKLAAIMELVKGEKESQVLYDRTPYEREVWIKYPISEGIEIHINRELEKTEGKRIAEIIRVARSILEGGGNNNE